jgi:3-oxoacyl-[acyl-carrier protein] reductase
MILFQAVLLSEGVGILRLDMEDNESIYNGSNPCGRYATPEEIANLALFMVGQTGDLIIGETFYMTGGSGSISMHR